MRVLGVLMVGIGALLMWEAWASHKTGTPPTPIQHIQASLSGQTNTAAQADTSTATTQNVAVM